MIGDEKIIEFLEKNKLNKDNLNLYIQAFIHRSFKSDSEKNNERLEFLGDAVLELIVTEYYIKIFLILMKENFLS